jgi:hypothetical protein
MGSPRHSLGHSQNARSSPTPSTATNDQNISLDVRSLEGSHVGRRPYGTPTNTPGHSRQGSRATATHSRHPSRVDATLAATPKPGRGNIQATSPLLIDETQASTQAGDETNSLQVSFDARTRYDAQSTTPPPLSVRRMPGARAAAGLDSSRNLVPNYGEEEGQPAEDHSKSSKSGTDPSTAPANFEHSKPMDHFPTVPLPPTEGGTVEGAPVHIHHGVSRSHDFSTSMGRRRSVSQPPEPPGEETPWTLVTDTMLIVWLVALIIYVCFLFAMGVTSWRISADIPESAWARENPIDVVPGQNATANGIQTDAPLARKEDPCGRDVPMTLIALAFFNTATCFFVIGWIVFFGLAVLPKLRAHHPGQGHVPFTFNSVFTPFVAYSTLVGLFVFTTAAICLYSLSITRIEDSYVQDICGAPFITLRAVGITFLTVTFTLMAVYGFHRHMLTRRARKINAAQHQQMFAVRNVVY